MRVLGSHYLWSGRMKFRPQKYFVCRVSQARGSVEHFKALWEQVSATHYNQTLQLNSRVFAHHADLKAGNHFWAGGYLKIVKESLF